MQSLKTQIATYLQSKQAEVGVALYHLENGDSLTLGNQRHYPMQSVYKLHLALAVLHQIDKGKFSLDQKIFIKKSDLLPNTWSPLREKYPQGEVELPLSEIIAYTVSQSDNNGCDILFRLIGGPKKAHKYIRSLGIKAVNIKTTEEEMGKAEDVQFRNWTTPWAVIEVLNSFYHKNILSKNSYDFLWKTLLATSTCPKRLKGELPEGTQVAHKTGSSGTNPQGITAATNDVGIICLPNGKHLAIVVLVSNSKENTETNEKIIADISKMAFDAYSKP
ncbi:MAG: class A beta-lactamase, subclass A2 [Bacteroidia bacterium]